MTVGIGVMPSEEAGVVLISDTFTKRIGAPPVTQSKLVGYHNPPAVLVISGILHGCGFGLGFGGDAVEASFMMPRWRNEDARKLLTGPVYLMASSIYNQLETRTLPSDDEPGAQVLAVTWPTDAGLQLVRMTSRGHQWAQPGDAYLIGCARGVPQEDEFKRPAPATLAECQRWAVDWIGRVMDAVWGKRNAFQLIQEGGAPCIGFPLEALTLTPDNIELEVIT